MFAERAFGLAFSLLIHAALTIFLITRAWEVAPGSKSLGDRNVMVVDLRPMAEEPDGSSPEQETQPTIKPPAPARKAERATPAPRHQAPALPTQSDMASALGSPLDVGPSASLAGSASARPSAISGDGASIQHVSGGAVQAVVAQAGAQSDDSYGAEVHRWIEQRKSYPPALSRRGLEGTAVVEFELDRQGLLQGPVRIIRSSGESSLDMLAVNQLRAASPFPRPPASATWKRRTFTVPMTYRPAV